MALITSDTYYREVQMSDRIAKEDIVQKNALGQNVVVVAKGDLIPAGVDVPKSKSTSEDAARDASTTSRKRS